MSRTEVPEPTITAMNNTRNSPRIPDGMFLSKHSGTSLGGGFDLKRSLIRFSDPRASLLSTTKDAGKGLTQKTRAITLSNNIRSDLPRTMFL